MSADDPSYTIGRGKPPLHTRFKKGQSGNPSGKPGPAKLARQRFQRALIAALDEPWDDLRKYQRGHNLEFMARRLARDALEGRLPSLKLILSELNGEIAQEQPERGDADEAEEAILAPQVRAEAKPDEPPPLEDYTYLIRRHRGEM